MMDAELPVRQLIRFLTSAVAAITRQSLHSRLFRSRRPFAPTAIRDGSSELSFRCDTFSAALSMIKIFRSARTMRHTARRPCAADKGALTERVPPRPPLPEAGGFFAYWRRKPGQSAVHARTQLARVS
jgi:hypothetical protein